MSRFAAVDVGPFRLVDELGAGGMGTVWRAVHRGSGLPAAVKVVRPATGMTDDHAAALRSEVRAVAALDHPGIVQIYDQGEIDEVAALASDGGLTAGSPWLAMELASGGTLDGLPRPVPWPRLRPLLLRLLDALAHAHARGVVHRDLKPNNVLLCAATDARPGLNLTDFGLARAGDLDEIEGQTEQISGTPWYMAPEQLRGHFRDYGPWTDLYALGCVAWELAFDRRPFEGTTLLEVAFSHMSPGRPAPGPAGTAPDGLGEWLLRLIALRRDHRFARAADAAWALRQLGPPGLDADLVFTAAVSRDGDKTLPMSSAPTAILAPALPRSEVAEAAVPRSRPEPPPVPATWRRPGDVEPAGAVPGAGLGLFGLRSVPLVGRVSERGVLWDALRSVHADARPRLVLLEGAAGTGKSRLAQWLCETAHELGAAEILRAGWAPMPGPADGLRPMFLRWFGCRGLSRDGIADRLLRQLLPGSLTGPLDAEQPSPPDDPDLAWELAALTELLSPRPATPEARAAARADRDAAVVRALRRVAVDRPVIVWLDDVQWGAEGLRLALSLLSRAASLPVLLLATARTEPLLERPQERALVARLAALPDVARHTLSPLDSRDSRELVSRLLGLDSGLVDTVRDRTAGNPLFAVQLVGDWVQRGVLLPGRGGLVLRAGETAPLPDDIHELWRARVAAVVEGAPDARAALEVAAALGQVVQTSEWGRACREAGVFLPPRLPESLAGRRLLLPREDGWAFAHGMLRESVERQAAEAGRSSGWHRACAAMLSAEPGLPTPERQERRGRHLQRAGQAKGAVPPLVSAARAFVDRGQYDRAERVASAAETGLSSAGVEGADPLWPQVWLAQAWIAKSMGRNDEADALGQRIELAVEEFGHRSVQWEAHYLRAEAARKRGDLDAAEVLFTAARAACPDRMSESWVLMGMAQAHLRGGDLVAARAEYQAARSMLSEDELPSRSGCLKGLGDIARRQGRLDEAHAIFEESLALDEARGDQHGQADCLNGLGEVARARGDLAAAERCYRRAMEHYDRIRSLDGVVVRANLGLLLVKRHAWPEARSVFEDALREVRAEDNQFWTGALSANLLPVLAGLGDWEAWPSCAETADTLLRKTGVVDDDIAWPLELAAKLATEAGRPAEAAEAAAMARRQWEVLHAGGHGG